MRLLMVVLLLGWALPALSMSLALAKVERAAEGETEQQVCARALEKMTQELQVSLLSVIAATDAYQQRKLAYREQDLSEALLEDAYRSQLMDEAPVLDGQRWSGSRCSLRARYSADVDVLARRVPMPQTQPRAVPDNAPVPPGIDPKTWELFSASRDRSELAQSFSTVSALRMYITEYYVSSGSWPQSLSDLGVAQEQLIDDRVKRAYLLQEGMLKLELAGRLEGHELTTWPVDSRGPRGIEWKCTTKVNMGPSGFCEQVE